MTILNGGAWRSICSLPTGRMLSSRSNLVVLTDGKTKTERHCLLVSMPECSLRHERVSPCPPHHSSPSFHEGLPKSPYILRGRRSYSCDNNGVVFACVSKDGCLAANSVCDQAEWRCNVRQRGLFQCQAVARLAGYFYSLKSFAASCETPRWCSRSCLVVPYYSEGLSNIW